MKFKRKLRNLAGGILAGTLIWLGYVRRAQRIAFEQNVILAIAFHNPDKKIFGKIVAWLKNSGFVFLSSSELIEILHRRAACPRGAVWISLDDGWRANLRNVIPVAEQYNVPVTIFIATDAVEEGTYWWRKVALAPEPVPVKFRQVEPIKKLPEEERKRIIKLIDQAGIQFPREAMTVEEIKDIARIPQVTLGAHTASHPILPQCPDSQMEFELGESKKKLEEWTGKKVNVFAYPNGSFDGRERPHLQNHGYELAATTDSKLASVDTDIYLFPRNLVMDDGSFAENLCHALGVWKPLVEKIKHLPR